MLDFHGWELPLQYGGILAEHRQCRESVALFDTCHMGQFLISGPGAGADLSRLLTCDAARLPVGTCRYALLLDERGMMLDDMIITRLDDDGYLLVVNAGPAARDAAWIGTRLSAGTRFCDRTGAWGKLDVQGPGSFRVLRGSVDFDLAALDYFQACRGRCYGFEAVISRTGYTGELGYEIFMPAADLAEVFSALLKVAGVGPAGLGARDLLRLEMGYPLYGQDMTIDDHPFEAGLDRWVALDRDFIGAAALRRIVADGVKRTRAAFRCDSRRRPEPGSPIRSGAQTVGIVSSGAFSPSLGVAIGMGRIDRVFAVAAAELTVDTARQALNAVVQAAPLYTQGTCRANIKELIG